MSTQYLWNSYPSQVVTTLCSTVYHRLMNVALRHYGKKAFMLENSLMKFSAYYVFTLNDYLFDRILATMRSLGISRFKKLSNKMVVCFASKLDDNTRFVLRQVWKQTDWLKSRVERPRDKSTMRRSNHDDGGVSTPGHGMIGATLQAMILKKIALRATSFRFMTSKSDIQTPALVADDVGPYDIRASTNTARSSNDFYVSLEAISSAWESELTFDV